MLEAGPHHAPGLRPRQLPGMHTLADALGLMVLTLIQLRSTSKYWSCEEERGGGDDEAPRRAI